MSKPTTVRVPRPPHQDEQPAGLFLNIPDEVARMTTLAPGAKLVFGAVNALCMGRLHRCVARDVTLAGMTGLSVKQVRRSLKILEDAGLIQRDGRGDCRDLTVAKPCPDRRDGGQIVPMEGGESGDKLSRSGDKLSKNPPSRGTNCTNIEMSSSLRSEDVERRRQASSPPARQTGGLSAQEEEPDTVPLPAIKAKRDVETLDRFASTFAAPPRPTREERRRIAMTSEPRVYTEEELAAQAERKREMLAALERRRADHERGES